MKLKMDTEIKLLPNSDNLDISYARKLSNVMQSFRSLNTSALSGTTTILDEETDDRKKIEPTPELTTYNIKLGWIQGVLIPCLLNIWGVMLFLRIAWIVGQAGIGLTVAIIGLSGVVCVITTLSLCAICTNGELQGGGVYYIVSRSLGAEMGASVGIIFAFANAVAASMNTIGFCESLNELLKSHNLRIVDNDVNDIRIVGAIALFVMCLICAFGMDWETRTQNFLIVIIVLAIFNYILGVFIGPMSDLAKAQGFVGINAWTAAQNLAPDFRESGNEQHNFFSVFAMYFPAVTGVQAGANICGDLKDPASAIPKGTLMALAISIATYLIMAVLCGVAALRDASGNVSELNFDTIDACKPNCQYGLHNNYGIMQLMAFSSAVIYAGCWAATLSTALTNLLSVPRLIQALGMDHIYPGLIFFSKPYGNHGEPYRGYVLTFFVSLMFLLIADLNTIAPLITNFYLASYALINFCTFHAALVMSINWRPTFQFYNRWLSLLGFLMCILIMMIISWTMALVTISIFLTLYLLVVYRKPDVSWGSSTEAQRYKETVSSLVQMTYMTENVKSYNPQLLVLAGRPYKRPTLLDMGHLITKNGSFMIVADINETFMSYAERLRRQQLGGDWLQSRNHRGFYVVVDGCSLEDGVRTVIQSTGLGRLTPNIVLIGYKSYWSKTPLNKLKSYVRMIQTVFEQQLAVAILRVPEIDQPKRKSQAKNVTNFNTDTRLHSQVLAIMHADSEMEFETQHDESNDVALALPYNISSSADESATNTEEPYHRHRTSPTLSILKPDEYNKSLVINEENSLDTWWLYDDGGLNVLLSYIIAVRGFHEKIPFRIFALARSCYELQDAEARMAALLQKVRLQYTSLTIIQGLHDPPRNETVQMFNTIIEHFKSDTESDVLVTEAELQRFQWKTHRHLRLRELLLEHSSNASMIVMTMPLPRQNSLPAALYMAWLEILSRDMPPVLFVRGNDTSVLGV